MGISVFVNVKSDSFARSIGFASKGAWLTCLCKRAIVLKRLPQRAIQCLEFLASTGNCLNFLPQRAIVLIFFASTGDFVTSVGD